MSECPLFAENKHFGHHAVPTTKNLELINTHDAPIDTSIPISKCLGLKPFCSLFYYHNAALSTVDHPHSVRPGGFCGMCTLPYAAPVSRSTNHMMPQLPTTDEIPASMPAPIRVSTAKKRPGKPMTPSLIHNELESRGVKHDLDCTTGSWTKTWLIRDSVGELRLIAAANMRPYLGPKKCATVACARGAAITWCNDVSTCPCPYPPLEHG
jgi:hypothetical protein